MYSMSLKWRFVFDAIVFAVFWLAILFRMALEGFPIKFTFALRGAWVIARAYRWVKGT